nr:MAG TPA: hypothetical protein [Caudoviricetes sp.]
MLYIKPLQIFGILILQKEIRLNSVMGKLEKYLKLLPVQ